MASDPVTPPTTDATKPHARTYASDVAALTGKQPPQKIVNTPAPVVPKPIPEPPPAVIIPKAPTTDESKEAVLARLRERAAAARPTPTETPTFAPIPEAPSTNESKEAVLKRLKERAGVAAPVPAMPPVTKPSTPPERLHTYTTDFAARANSENATRISVLAAQADAAPLGAVLKERARPNTLAVVLGGVLIVAGMGAVYAAYRFATGSPPIPQEQAIPSLIFVDERVKLEGSAEDLRTLLATGANISLSPGEAAVTYLSYATTTKDGPVEIVASGAELIEALRLPAPSLLLRAIEPESTVGIYASESETRPFFLFKVDSYDRSFAGMLEWERTLERDLALFYPAYPAVVAASVGTSTASTTPVAPPSFRLSFVDEVESNRDVRVLKDADNRTLMLYGYYDKRILILARDEAAFTELVTRLSSTLR